MNNSNLKTRRVFQVFQSGYASSEPVQEVLMPTNYCNIEDSDSISLNEDEEVLYPIGVGVGGNEKD